MVTPSLLSRVIESQGQDTEIMSIRDRVQAGTGDEVWVICKTREKFNFS